MKMDLIAPSLLSHGTRSKLGMLVIAAAIAVISSTYNKAWAAPERLTSLQLDTVSAGHVAVSTTATATALGPSGRTATKTNTFTKSLPNGVVELGLARGKAYACCGPDTDANVQTDSYADGAIVNSHSTNIKMSNSKFAKAHGVEVIVSVNPPGLVGR